MSLFKKVLLGFAGLIGTQAAKTQQLNLQEYSKEQTGLQRNGMYILAGWAGANIISGAYLTGKTSGTAQSFHLMNVYWNIVNGVLAGSALLRLSKKMEDESFAAVYKKQQSLEKIFLLNTGLDVAYVAGGIYLNEKSKTSTTKSAQLKGYGNSVVLQGGFLLLFDGIMYGLLHSKGKKLEKVLEKVQVSSSGTGLSVVVKM